MRYGELVDFCWGACLGRFVTGDTGRWLVIAIEYLGDMKLAPCLTKRLGGGFWISRLGLLADQEMLANVSTEQKNERLAGEASVVCRGSALQHSFRPIRACQLRTGLPTVLRRGMDSFTGSRLAAAGSVAPLGTLMTSIETMPLKSGKRGVSGIGGLFSG